jgi:hypothetical protein
VGVSPESVAAPEVYQLRAWLIGISPMVWRRVLVRADSTIADLHYTLQIAFDWSDGHLNRFHIHGQEYGVEHLGGIGFADDPTAVSLASFDFRPRERFQYEYDFGDSWLHEIRVERVLGLDPKRTYPVCIAGKRATPPEDCGGPEAYMEDRGRLKCRAVFGYDFEDLDDEDPDEDGPRHFDPDHFSRLDVNKRMKRYARGDSDWWR